MGRCGASRDGSVSSGCVESVPTTGRAIAGSLAVWEITAVLARRDPALGSDPGVYHCVVERTLSWLHQYCRLADWLGSVRRYPSSVLELELHTNQLNA